MGLEPQAEPEDGESLSECRPHLRRHGRQGEGSWGLHVNITMNSERDKLKSMEAKKNCCLHAYAKKRGSCRNQRQVGNIFHFSLNCFHGQDLSLGPILPIFQTTTLRLERWSDFPKRPTGLVCDSPRTRPRASAQDSPGWTEDHEGPPPTHSMVCLCPGRAAPSSPPSVASSGLSWVQCPWSNPQRFLPLSYLLPPSPKTY